MAAVLLSLMLLPSWFSSLAQQTSRIDLVVWRPATGTWYVNSSTGSTTSKQWGLSEDIPVVADFDGDGNVDYAVWRPSSGTWFVTPSGGAPAFSKQWGLSGDIPVPADYDGDGKTDFAVWRPSDGTWYIAPASGAAPIIRQWGISGDVPVPGDFDGDRKADCAVWRPASGTWYVLTIAGGATLTRQWGLNGDIPVSGDFDGDHKTDFAVWRPGDGTWYVQPVTGAPSFTRQWGLNGDVPVPRDYDRDGKTDYAVWRPSNGTWFILASASGAPQTSQWGLQSDVPVYRPAGMTTVSTTPASRPVINSFSAQPTSIQAGASTLLSWDVSNATSIVIDNSIGAVAGTGSRSVSPAASVTYTLTATNSSGSATASVPVVVTAQQLPTINQFSADSTSITAGQSTTLRWSVANAAAVSISGLGSVSASGAQQISPSAPTTYTLTATNNAGNSTASVTVSVQPQQTGGGGGGTGGSGNYSVPFETNETNESSVTLTGAKPTYLDTSDVLSLSKTSLVWVFTAAEYAAKFWALDATNAQNFLNGQSFQGYPLPVGMEFVTLPAGNWWVGVQADQTVFATYQNPTYHELDVVDLPQWYTAGNAPLAVGGAAGAWKSQPFNWPTGDVRAYIETEGSGGKFMIMSSAQYQAFSTTYANGFNGGSYAYTYACGGQSGGAATEIECEMQLNAGNWVLVYLNDTGNWQGGAANIQFYRPN